MSQVNGELNRALGSAFWSWSRFSSVLLQLTLTSTSTLNHAIGARHQRLREMGKGQYGPEVAFLRQKAPLLATLGELEVPLVSEEDSQPFLIDN